MTCTHALPVPHDMHCVLSPGTYNCHMYTAHTALHHVSIWMHQQYVQTLLLAFPVSLSACVHTQVSW